MSKYITTIAFAFGVLIGILLLVTLPAMWLWNWLMPMIFHLPTLTFLQMLGLLTLSNLLFNNRVTTTKPSTT